MEAVVRMPIVEREIVIHRPIEVVFDFVADGRNEPQYNPDSLHTEQLTEDALGRGTQYRSAGRMMGRQIEVVYELTAYERPHRLALRLIQPPPMMALQGTQTFGALPEGTQIQWRYDVMPRGAGKLMSPLIARMFGQRLDRTLRNLKHVLETSEATPPGQST